MLLHLSNINIPVGVVLSVAPYLPLVRAFFDGLALVGLVSRVADAELEFYQTVF